MWKRRNLTPQQNAESIVFNTAHGLRVTNLREPSPVDEFYSEKSTDAAGIESVAFVDPIIMLFNQQRLDNLGQMAAKSFLDSFSQKTNQLDELRAKCSDEDLFKMIKSKHLQSPAEILAWCRYMNENIQTFNKEVQKLMQEQIDKDTSLQPSVVPTQSTQPIQNTVTL